MASLTESELFFLQAVSNLGYCNPFLPDRLEYEREVLGRDFQQRELVWSMRVDKPDSQRVNPLKISVKIEAVVRRCREHLANGAAANEQELVLYEDAIRVMLFHRYQDDLGDAMFQILDQKRNGGQFGFYAAFLRDWEHYLQIPGVTLPTQHRAPHLFACFAQIIRAFRHIFNNIIGHSLVTARLRAAVWQSIFSHNLRRYINSLYQRMGDVTTLITGPSGTGKELVARAIGFSRYIPFDPKRMTFSADFTGLFHPLNLSALSPQLIESELFGHRRGAFTGALQDWHGWLDVCTPEGAIFLDEVGDLDASIQVKLLRVLQTRTFQRVGDTKDRYFHGKIIAATNRDLAEAMQRGNFREDLYYRLCSDMIVTPSLHDQLRESPAELRELLLFIARNVAGTEAESLAQEVEAWISKNLRQDYEWPGNIRELEQCVRSILIRKEYQPLRPRALPIREEITRAIVAGTLTADDVLRRYCTLVYLRTGSYEETARRLQLDRRTVKSKIDPQLLRQLRDAG